MAPSFSRVSSGALLLALAYNARPVNADFWEDVDNCKLVLDDLPADLTTGFCQDWTYGYQPEDEYVTVTGYPVTVTEYPDAKTCEGEGYSTTTKYPESTPAPSKGYPQSKPTKTPNESTSVPSESTSVPNESTSVPDESTSVPSQTTEAPTQPPSTNAPGGYDVTVTSTSWTTYWTTSTIYEGYPTATPAPYRRHARDLNERASWCVDRPCRLVQYDDDTIVEACKKYLGWGSTTSTVNVPGYTVTVTSYPTDCKKKDDGYKPDPVPAYPTDKDDGYQPDPYPTETPDPYPTTDYPEDPYPTDDSYPEETPDYEPQPYPPGPGPYADDQSDYDNSGPAPWENDNTDDPQHSDDKLPWEDDFDTNYSGPDGPLPWDDVDQTSELADAIDTGDYDSATQELGLDDAPWNALPVDYPQKRDYPTGDSYDSYGDDGVDDDEPSYDTGSDDYDVVWVDENGNPIDESDYPEDDSYEPTDDSYKPTDDSYDPTPSYPSGPQETDYPPNVYGPDVPSSGDYSDDSGSDYPSSNDYPSSDDYPSYDDSSDAYPSYTEPTYELPDSSEYEGDEYESDYSAPADDTSDADYWGGEDGSDY